MEKRDTMENESPPTTHEPTCYRCGGNNDLTEQHDTGRYYCLDTQMCNAERETVEHYDLIEGEGQDYDVWPLGYHDTHREVIRSANAGEAIQKAIDGRVAVPD